MIVYLCSYTNPYWVRKKKFILWTTNVADYVEFMSSRNPKYYTQLDPAVIDGGIEEVKKEFKPEHEIVIAALRTAVTKEVEKSEYTADTRVHVPMTKFEYNCVMARRKGVMCNHSFEDKRAIDAYDLASPKLKEALEIYNFDAYMSGFFPDWYDVDVLQLFLEDYGHLLKED